jgi:hypothetical protein
MPPGGAHDMFTTNHLSGAAPIMFQHEYNRAILLNFPAFSIEKQKSSSLGKQDFLLHCLKGVYVCMDLLFNYLRQNSRKVKLERAESSEKSYKKGAGIAVAFFIYRITFCSCIT